jgi:hypothetical protein
MFSISASILLAAHLLCVNLAMTGPLACVALRWHAARHQDPLADRVGRWLVRVCIVALLVAMGLGIASGLLLWFGGQRQFFDALGRLPARRIYWGLVELVFYFVCMIIYGALWYRWRTRPVLHGSIAIIAATNLMYHFPPLFVLIGWLAAGGHAGVEPISAGQLLQLMFSPSVLAPVAHHLLASFAVVGIVVMLGTRRLSSLDTKGIANETDSEATQAAAIVRRAAVVALSVTLLQLPTGLWVVLQLTGAQRDRLLGGAWPATGLFIAAMVTALSLLHWLSVIALGQTGRREVYLASLLLAVLTLLMSGVLREVRKERAAADLTTSKINRLEACDNLQSVGNEGLIVERPG